ncbi:MAG: non-homologous end-joining DNA ligase, partial [Candidatus Rokuibacteriota bacterium]
MSPTAPAIVPWRESAGAVRPMLASLDAAPLTGESWVYEPKYDGIRALVEVTPGSGSGGVRIWSRLGAEKTRQFPEIVRALDDFRRRLEAAVLIDGEIVALDAGREPTGFQGLQGRIHLTSAQDIAARARAEPAGFVAFDILRDGGEDLRPLPLAVRRAQLERVLGNAGAGTLRLSEFVPGDGTTLHRRAGERGWEGLVAKRLDSPYRSGRRSPEWRKVKIQRREDFVVGGFTEGRSSRSHFGALLLGAWHGDALEYVGHTGTGFSEAELARLAGLLRPLETPRCPFRTRPRTNERPHWVEPRLVAQVRFTEWTADGKLRHPAYLGLRDDVRPRQAGRAPAAITGPNAGGGDAVPGAGNGPLEALIRRLEALEAEGGGGTLALPDGARLEVSNLGKVFWTQTGITKGELLRHYVRLASLLLPAVADRPLVMKRFPNGIHARAFFQQRAPAQAPPGVRVEVVAADRVVPSRLVGGSLLTLLFMAQYAVVSQDPWFSR